MSSTLLPVPTTTTLERPQQPAATPAAPGTAPVAQLDVEHPEVTEYKRTWLILKLLYEGGDLIRRSAESVLRKKAKELPELYQDRKEAMTYQNVLGAGIDYYLASIFERDPDLDSGTLQSDGTFKSVDLAPQQQAYYSAFQKNADRRGNSLIDVFRDVLQSLLLYQRSWILVDLPTVETPPLTLGEQMRQGLLDAYLVRYTVFEVINWCEGIGGDLEWVVIKTCTDEQPFLGKPVKIDRWYYFDKQSYRLYERRKTGAQAAPEQAQLIAGPAPHALADIYTVPVVKIEVPKGLWLANRVLPQVLDHLNTDNEYAHALRKTNLSMPVIAGNFNENPTLSEGGFLKIPAGAQLSWTEPPGGSFQRSEFRVASLREEIYRQMYLMAQGRSAVDSPAVQSGYSKQLEMRPAAHVQNYLGDTLRKSMERVLNFVTHIRQDRVQWTVRGFDFTEDQTDVELQRSSAFMSLQCPSPTAQRENQKRAVHARFKDAGPELLDTIDQEIDALPTPEEKAEAEKQLQQQMMVAGFEQDMQQKEAEGAQAKKDGAPAKK